MNTLKKETFQINELCWVKIVGYPWWPAVVSGKCRSNKKTNYCVNYICERSNSVIDRENIKKWKENYESFKSIHDCKKNNKINLKLKCAVKIADLLYDGLIDLKDHEKFLEKYKNSKECHKLCNITSFFDEILNSNKSCKKIKSKGKSYPKINDKTKKVVNSKIPVKGKNKKAKTKEKKVNKIEDNKDENNVIVLSDSQKSEKESKNHENDKENNNENRVNKNEEKNNNEINNFKQNINLIETKEKYKSTTIKKIFLGKKKRRFNFSATKEGEIKLEGIEKKSVINNNINIKNTNKNNDLINLNISPNLNENNNQKKLSLNEEDQKFNIQSDIIKYDKSICDVFDAPPGVSNAVIQKIK